MAKRLAPGAAPEKPGGDMKRCATGGPQLVVPGAPLRGGARPTVGGKFFEVGGCKLQVRGATYGTFAESGDGLPYPERERVSEDFAQMAQAGINTVRTYTVPPEWLLDLAAQNGIRALVGLPWEEHVAFLDGRGTGRSIIASVRDGVRACARHPAMLGFSVGNEIPAPIARWHGRAKIERFIERLYEAAKEEDPESLVTYVNYPTTEYLQLPFLDFTSFNVFLEDRDILVRYLARLHTLADDRPLVVTELGLDSRQHGLDRQAECLAWQVEAALEGGCAGAFVFAWTDEWNRGGHDIEDWDFGLVDRERRAKPALEAVSGAFSRLWAADRQWPKFTVVVCTHNGSRSLPECLDAVRAQDYPDFEVVLVDDGSTDESASIAAERGVEVVRSEENRGLSSARNLGAARATGEVIAYLDDDARPDPHWLRFLAVTFDQGHAAVGGPNLAPPGDGRIADAVSDSPGGPVHVLLSDVDAEHVPGCNLAVRRDVLEELGGFDPQFWIAGDDVDFCWRLQGAGHTIGFSPTALVWHHRRSSLRGYVRQQYHYGKAEALLERKWPQRYNRMGHVTWSGNVYGESARQRPSRRAKIGYGTWGSRLFQSIYQPDPRPLLSMAMPEWYLVAFGLAALSALGLAWTPLFFALPALTLLTLAMAASAVARETRPKHGASPLGRAAHRGLVVVMSMIQPLARLAGRLRHGLSPWRRPGTRACALPWRRGRSVWSETWAPHDRWLETVEMRLQPGSHGAVRGTDWDRWDLQVRVGAFGSARLLCAVEEHGRGRQLVRFRSWPKYSVGALLLPPVVALTAAAAAIEGALVPSAVLGFVTLLIVALATYDCAIASGILLQAIDGIAPLEVDAPATTPPVKSSSTTAVQGRGASGRRLRDADDGYSFTKPQGIRR